MTETLATTKGAILRSLLKFIDRDLTEEQRARAFEALPPDEREYVGRPILAGEKIPERMLNRLTVEAARAKGDSLEQWGRRAGRAELADSVGVYRFFVMVLTPASLMRKASSFWSTVHSQGKLAVESEEPNKAKVVLTDFPSEPAHCARLAGWMEGAGEMTGAKKVDVVHDACITRGARECTWQINWI